MPSDVIAQLATAAAAKRGPRFTYDVPESARLRPDDPKVVTLVPITVDEDTRALNAAQNSGGIAYIFECLKYSLVEVDGRQLDWATGDRDIIERVSPKIRELLVKAHRKINTPAKAEEDGFFASERVEI